MLIGNGLTHTFPQGLILSKEELNKSPSSESIVLESWLMETMDMDLHDSWREKMKDASGQKNLDFILLLKLLDGSNIPNNHAPVEYCWQQCRSGRTILLVQATSDNRHGQYFYYYSGEQEVWRRRMLGRGRCCLEDSRSRFPHTRVLKTSSNLIPLVRRNALVLVGSDGCFVAFPCLCSPMNSSLSTIMAVVGGSGMTGILHEIGPKVKLLLSKSFQSTLSSSSIKLSWNSSWL